MLKANVPTSASELVKDLKESEVVPGLFAAFTQELLTCIQEATKAKEPQIYFSEMVTSEEQHIWTFWVNDMAKPLTPAYNWHGQNTSQWVYAGAVVLQDGKVSRHH